MQNVRCMERQGPFSLRFTGFRTSASIARPVASQEAGGGGGVDGPPAPAVAAKMPKAKSWPGLLGELSKARLSALVVATTAGGFLLAGPPQSTLTLAAACGGTALCAASANTFNQVYEHKTDALMKRTRHRPLPSGRVSLKEAAAIGALTGLTGTTVLAVGCNELTALLGAANILLYAGVYTPMKRKSEWNTWMGSLVGAIPPAMGLTAATGTLMSPEACLLGGTLFLWQFPHFFSLAWLHKADYAAGGHAMVPCKDPTGMRTAALIRKYTAMLTPLPFAAAACGVTTYMFPIEFLAINGFWLWQAQKFYSKPSNGNARQVFRTSLWYLPVVMSLMVYHSHNWAADEDSGSNVLAKACPHEVLFNGDEASKMSTGAPTLCVKKQGDEAVQRAATVSAAIEIGVNRN